MEVIDRGARIQFEVWARDSSVLHNVQTGTGFHPGSCAMDTEGSFPRVNAARA
jgi:hypothetical protein